MAEFHLDTDAILKEIEFGSGISRSFEDLGLTLPSQCNKPLVEFLIEDRSRECGYVEGRVEENGLNLLLYGKMNRPGFNGDSVV